MVIPLPRDSGRPAYARLAESIREAILSGRFVAGDRLPASRNLALTHGVARNTVIDAYEQLIAEGYLEPRRGAGTFVAAEMPDSAFEASPHRREPRQSAGRAGTAVAAPRLSPFGLRVLESQSPVLTARRAESARFEFRYGTPSLSEFPLDTWKTLTRRIFDYSPEDLLRGGTPEGLPALREAIARYLQRARGVHCSADDVIIVNGSQQAIDLTARVLVGPGDIVAVEEPCYPGSREVFAAGGAMLAPVRFDEAGLRAADLPDEAKLVCVTPSHQFPTGAVMSVSRRLELLQWAREHDALILEDDYDSEFRYEGQPIGSLQGLDESGRVIYTGTMSKVLSPALRLGYMVAPPRIREALLAAKFLTDRHAPLPYQAVLALFIEEGHFERHLRRMRKVYSSRRRALIEAFASHFGDRVQVAGTDSGLHVLVRIAGVRDEREFIRAARKQGIGITSARDCYLSPTEEPGALLIMGYSSVDEAGIREGVARLRRLLPS